MAGISPTAQAKLYQATGGPIGLRSPTPQGDSDSESSGFEGGASPLGLRPPTRGGAAPRSGAVGSRDGGCAAISLADEA